MLSGLFSKSNFFGKMSEKRFVAYETSVKDYVLKHGEQKHEGEDKTRLPLFEEFLRKEKNDLSEVHTIATAELNKYRAEFIRPIRRSEGVSSQVLSGN